MPISFLGAIHPSRAPNPKVVPGLGTLAGRLVNRSPLPSSYPKVVPGLGTLAGRLVILLGKYQHVINVMLRPSTFLFQTSSFYLLPSPYILPPTFYLQPAILRSSFHPYLLPSTSYLLTFYLLPHTFYLLPHKMGGGGKAWSMTQAHALG